MLSIKDYERLFKRGRKTIGEHEPLLALTFASDNGDSEKYSEHGWEEIVYTVPEKWLKKYMKILTGREWTSRKLRKWLREEYDSEDSSRIFDQAVLEHQLVTMNIY